jgi:hypothetical protein
MTGKANEGWGNHGRNGTRESQNATDRVAFHRVTEGTHEGYDSENPVNPCEPCDSANPVNPVTL